MKDWDNDAESIFNQESREKKRIGNGVYAKTGKRGYVGTMRTPYDLMSRKEKREYSKGSEVKVSNIYAEGIRNIPSLKELDAMNVEKATNIVMIAKETYTNEQLKKHWGISHYLLYMKVFKKYGLWEGDFTKKRDKKDKDKPAVEKVAEIVKEPVPVNTDVFTAEQIAKSRSIAIYSDIVVKPQNEETSIVFIRELSGDDARNKLVALLNMLENDSKYKIELIVKELL